MVKYLFTVFIYSSCLLVTAQEPPKTYKKGVAYIMPMGNGIYQSSISGKSGFISTAKLKMKVYDKGLEFAKDKDAQLEVVGYKTIEQSFMVFPQAIMSFRLVYNSIEVNDPNDPNTITVTKTGNILNNNQQTTVKMSSPISKPQNPKTPKPRLTEKSH